MLNALKFVQGAVSKKDYEPALKHFRIEGGRILGYNGTIALSAPIGMDIEAIPEATPFIRAIERCNDDTTVVHMTAGRKLALKSGKFHCHVNCLDDATIFERVKPEGVEVPLPGGVLHALDVLEPFIGVDASKLWATGILLRGSSAFATNNIIVIEHWLGTSLPYVVNIPAQAVREILRIGLEPNSMTLSENSMTLHYGDRWLRTNLLNPEWPDVDRFLSVESAPVPIPAGFFDALETLAPFTEQNGRVYFRDEYMTTHLEGGAGANVKLDSPLPSRGSFDYRYLALLKGVAETADFTKHPQPSPFVGKFLRGIIMGLTEA